MRIAELHLRTPSNSDQKELLPLPEKAQMKKMGENGIFPPNAVQQIQLFLKQSDIQFRAEGIYFKPK